MFKCGFCGKSSRTCVWHLEHLKYHRNLSRNIHCGFQGQCKKTFSTERLLRMHLLRYHRFKIADERVWLKSRELAVDLNARFVCNVGFCKTVQTDYPALIKHLKDHIRCGVLVNCPYRNCRSKFNKLGSFTGHLSKKHKTYDSLQCSSPLVELESLPEDGGSVSLESAADVGGNSSEMPNESTQQEHSDPLDCDIEGESGNDDHPGGMTPAEDDLYGMNLAVFFLKLECQFLVPASTVQYIYNELAELQVMQNKIRSEKLRALLSKDLSADQVDRVLRFIDSSDPFTEQSFIVKSDYRRKQFYKERFHFVKPQEIKYIGQEGHYHYVPILQTCEAILRDNTLDLSLDIPYSDNNLLLDFTDGEVFKSNKFFKENPRSLRLGLYADSFNLATPIGPARMEGKILAIYLICGNIPLHQRSQVKRISLVALCKESEFNHPQVCGRIVKDLKTLETTGVKNAQGEMIKGSLAFISGDNLGSAELAGLTANFSRAEYFCRYCLGSRSDIFGQCICARCKPTDGEQEESSSQEDDPEESPSNSEGEVEESELDSEDDENDEGARVGMDVEDRSDNSDAESGTLDGTGDETDDTDVNPNHLSHHMRYFPPRTPESYEEDLRQVGRGNNHRGVKFNSTFNQLDNYHVCMPGMPPCLGHDGPEGIMTHDVPLFIRHFVKNKWFTYDQLNARIRNFKYSRRDQRDKPKPVKAIRSTLVGGAWQIWTFVRLFPLIIDGFVKNANDPVWIAFMTLTEIFEIIISPRIHTSFLAYLQVRINSYLAMRGTLFKSVRLRPKHHFLYHYPWLIKMFGPLMRVFTLRCESKHFFKRVIHAIRTFKNLTFSLSEKHELFQAFVRAGGETKESDGIREVSQFNRLAYAPTIISAMDDVGLSGVILEGSSLVFQGHEYRKGAVVVLGQKVYRYDVEFGVITLITQDENEKIFFVVSVVESSFQPKTHLHKLGSHIKFHCVALQDLYTHEPQHIYVRNACHYVKLTHGLVANQF